MARTPAILVPSGLAPQVEVFAKSVKAVTDSLLAATQTPGASLGTLAQLQAEVAALSAAVAKLEQEIPSGTASASIVAAQTIGVGQLIASANGQGVVADVGARPDAILGVALASGVQGDTIPYALPGESAVVATTGLVAYQACWLGDNGSVTQVRPTSGNVVLVGYADGSSSMVVLIVPAATYSASNKSLPVGIDTTSGQREFLPFPVLPSVNAIAGGNEYVVVSSCNLLIAAAFGLDLHGTLTLHGNAAFV